jgi:tetratricopeptide (TPR) repeat protein
MIVRDGEEYLAQCLASAREVVDEIVIGDTGSTDSSVRIAQDYGARVIFVPWENDFAKARNRVVAENKADWILSLDADEMLDAEDRQAIRALLVPPDVAGYDIRIWNYVVSLTKRLWDIPAKPNPNRLEEARRYPAYVEHQNVRLFRRDPEIYFEGQVHESTGYRILHTGRKLAETNLVIHHFGLALEGEARIRKSRFYCELGREKIRQNPSDAMPYFEVGVEELNALGDPAAALSCFERVIELAPRAYRAWAFAGIALVQLGRFAEGLKRLKRAEKLGGRSGMVCEAKGEACYQLGDFAAARRCYESAQEQGIRSAVLESRIGVCEVRLGRTESGLRRIVKAVEREPGRIELYDLLTSAAAWAGNLELAAKTAQVRLSAAEPTPEGYMRAASIRAQLKQWPAVIELLQAGIARFPEAATLQRALEEVRRGFEQKPVVIQAA